MSVPATTGQAPAQTREDQFFGIATEVVPKTDPLGSGDSAPTLVVEIEEDRSPEDQRPPQS